MRFGIKFYTKYCLSNLISFRKYLKNYRFQTNVKIESNKYFLKILYNMHVEQQFWELRF